MVLLHILKTKGYLMRLGIVTTVVSIIALAVVGMTTPPQESKADTLYNQPETLQDSEYPNDTLSLAEQTLEESTEAFVNEEILCLAKNIYFESGNQSTAGKMAVAHVVFNRVESTLYPDTICGVVYQAKLSKWHLENTGKEVPVRNKCQFSWYCDGLPDDPLFGENWYKSLEIASSMYDLWGEDLLTIDITDGAMYYHATYVNPYWAKSMTKTTRIGDHIFYR
jgi:N-acetylmuramoyl-L-alanine amidase